MGIGFPDNELPGHFNKPCLKWPGEAPGHGVPVDAGGNEVAPPVLDEQFQWQMQKNLEWINKINVAAGDFAAILAAQVIFNLEAGASGPIQVNGGNTIDFHAAGAGFTVARAAKVVTYTIAAGTYMETFILSADGGLNQEIANGNTLEVTGGDGISTECSATDTVTIDMDMYGSDSGALQAGDVEVSWTMTGGKLRLYIDETKLEDC